MRCSHNHVLVWVHLMSGGVSVIFKTLGWMYGLGTGPNASRALYQLLCLAMFAASLTTSLAPADCAANSSDNQSCQPIWL